MLEYLNFFVGGLLLGIWITMIRLNGSHDSKCRDIVKKLVNNVVRNFYRHYSVTNNRLSATTARLDFQLRTLIDNTLLIPIIGKKHFDNLYYPRLSEFYSLSTPSPKDMTPDEIEDHLLIINKSAVELLKIVDHKSGKIRLFSRR